MRIVVYSNLLWKSPTRTDHVQDSRRSSGLNLSKSRHRNIIPTWRPFNPERILTPLAHALHSVNHLCRASWMNLLNPAGSWYDFYYLCCFTWPCRVVPRRICCHHNSCMGSCLRDGTERKSYTTPSPNSPTTKRRKESPGCRRTSPRWKRKLKVEIGSVGTNMCCCCCRVYLKNTLGERLFTFAERLFLGSVTNGAQPFELIEV